MADGVARFSHKRMLRRENERNDPTTWTSRSSRGMIVTAHYLATAAGAEMLARGGDAVDAAIAASLALGACEPAGSGLGGMAMLAGYRSEGRRAYALAGPCRAPAAATPEGVSESKRYRGYRAVAVPSIAAVLDAAHSRYGRLPLDDLFAPAIRFAEEGVPITPMQHALIRRYRGPLRGHSAGRFFLGPDRNALPAGAILRQPVLAETMKRLANTGLRDFYEGEIGRRIHDDMVRHNGFVRDLDLASFSIPSEGEPIEARFGDMTVATLGPPAGGPALVQVLNLLHRTADGDFDLDSPAGAVLMASIIRHSRLDRRRYRLTTGAESLEQSAELLTTEYAERVSGEILGRMAGEGETSHISVVDQWGNAVSMTQSIERSFGAAEAGANLGFIYNGFMRCFKVENREHPHYLRPGAAARSNAAPAILLRGGEAVGAIGNTGSERLASGIAGTLVRLRRQSPFEAVLGPRLHCTPKGIVMLEADRFSAAARAALESHGFTLKPFDPYAFKFGGLNLVVRDGDEWCGVSEPRRDGTAAGPEDWEALEP